MTPSSGGGLSLLSMPLESIPFFNIGTCLVAFWDRCWCSRLRCTYGPSPRYSVRDSHQRPEPEVKRGAISFLRAVRLLRFGEAVRVR